MHDISSPDQEGRTEACRGSQRGGKETDRSKELGRKLCVATSPKAVFSPPRGSWRPVLLGATNRSPWSSPQGKSPSSATPQKFKRSIVKSQEPGCAAFPSRRIWQSFQAWVRVAKEMRCQKLEISYAKVKRSAAGRLMFRLGRAGRQLADAKDHFQLYRVLHGWKSLTTTVQQMRRVQLCCRSIYGWRAVIERKATSCSLQTSE